MDTFTGAQQGTLNVLIINIKAMDISALLAQVIGLYLLMEGLVILTQKKFVMNVVIDMSNHKALVTVTGAMLTVLGLLIVLNHNVWEASWQVVPTIVGWAMLAKGVMLFFIPKTILGHARKVAKNRNLMMFAGIVAVAVGAYLAYSGFGLGM